LGLIAAYFSYQVSAIGDKPWPIVGRRDESYASLSAEEKNVTMGFLNDFKEVRITAKDGIILQAIVFDPKPATRNGKNPVLIFISSWGMNKWEYVVPAHDYAKKGYTVISYTARGFWGSGGQINLAGEKDMADVSTVIDWALANTNADSTRIGLSGISYGGGMSLLAAARDSRVKSAVSMSCWIDLAQSFLGNGESIRKEAARFLQALGYLTGEVGDDLALLFTDYFSNTDLNYLYTFTFNSSAVNYIDQINANKPAIFIANAFSDSLFTPDQFPTRFYNKLTGNKHLEYAPGDHAGPELIGLLGLPDQVWNLAAQWNDYYVRDAKKDTLTSMSAIVFNTFNGDEIESYMKWEEVTNAWSTYQLDTNEHLTLSTTSKNKKPLVKEGELTTIVAGENANIYGGIAFITATVRSYIQQPLHFAMNLIKRQYAAVFQTDAFAYTTRIRGTAQVTLNIIPKSSSSGTLVMYLLDVDAATNEGRLITFAPWTFKNAIIGEPLTLSMEITMTSYDMPIRNSLAIVIQTHDMLFLDQNTEKAEIVFLSGSTLSIPLHA
jgi:predicted acyl esterase